MYFGLNSPSKILTLTNIEIKEQDKVCVTLYRLEIVSCFSFQAKILISFSIALLG